MEIYNLTKEGIMSERNNNWYNKDEEFFIICNPTEMDFFGNTFKFDPYTILECINLDENIRFESYNGYDFISLMYFYMESKNLIFTEINLYIGKNYIIFVLPADKKVNDNFINFVINIKNLNSTDEDVLVVIYYKIFHKVLSDLFSTLEEFEDIISGMQLRIIEDARKEQLAEIIIAKSMANRINKLLRPLIYIGDQFIINENNFIPEDKMKFFKNIDTRMNKLFGFSETINDMAMQLMHLYDSKIGMQTNEVVTKLTLLTVFIGPLTVITGIYGMNFVYMPELGFKYGYPIVIVLMCIITISIFIYLKKNKKWM